MRASEYAELFDAEPHYQVLAGEPWASIMEPARRHSRLIGQGLLAYLSRIEAEPDIRITEELLQGEVDWGMQGGLAATRAAIDALPASPERYMADSELNWHELQSGMGHLWLPMVAYQQTNAQRAEGRLYSRHFVAQRSVEMIAEREIVADIASGHVYFSDEASDVRASVEGTLTEFDSAIVLMEVTRHYPDLTVVPAPPQFEHGKRSRYNADFVVVDTSGQAVGVQVKTQISDEDRRRYDPQAVVLVDGRHDLGNTLYKRTKAGRSTEQRVSWAGLICASVPAELNVKGNGACGPYVQALKQRLGPVAVSNILARKQHAKQILGNLKPMLPQAAAIVGDRVMRALYADAA